MRIKENYVLQEIMDDFIVIPIGEEADRMNGVIKLNETGAFLWNLLVERDLTEDELISELVKKYKVDLTMAQEDIYCFVGELTKLGCLKNKTK